MSPAVRTAGANAKGYARCLIICVPNSPPNVRPLFAPAGWAEGLLKNRACREAKGNSRRKGIASPYRGIGCVVQTARRPQVRILPGVLTTACDPIGPVASNPGVTNGPWPASSVPLLGV